MMRSTKDTRLVRGAGKKLVVRFSRFLGKAVPIMDFGRKIICPMDGYTEKTVYMVELTDDNGKKTGYLSNGCDDANGGEVCERCRRDVAAKFSEDFKG